MRQALKQARRDVPKIPSDGPDPYMAEALSQALAEQLPLPRRRKKSAKHGEKLAEGGGDEGTGDPDPHKDEDET